MVVVFNLFGVHSLKGVQFMKTRKKKHSKSVSCTCTARLAHSAPEEPGASLVPALWAWFMDSEWVESGWTCLEPPKLLLLLVIFQWKTKPSSNVLRVGIVPTPKPSFFAYFCATYQHFHSKSWGPSTVPKILRASWFDQCSTVETHFSTGQILPRCQLKNMQSKATVNAKLTESNPPKLICIRLISI